ncbi:helix-turn-helix transcriptional regulator [Streptomyces sp. AM 4-1-1]|uniref:helix-turn-helix domain-containing protein n=1 Tax=Streptomyces sp. AM 4-1-1 TaxID=3028710 RepID=UPI0023B8D227|nr:helix-turn-helix transcriptional regulator [Streptomyces sp. AM 4-1-1]WEH35570.1 helix-turn-helix transcriptional regulator [Streptomyces sp. AM 4-1-1]
MAPTSPPTFRRRRLGGALRRMREEHGLTQQEVADRIGYRIDRVSRIETGRTKVDVPALRAMLDVYGVDDLALRAAMEDMARNVSQRGWWHSYASFLHLAFQDFLGLESDASELCLWESLLVPGLLQTEEYTRGLLAAGVGVVHSSSERIDKLVSVRLERQQVLEKANPLQLCTVIGEAALRNPIGDTGVMRRQLEHILHVSRLENAHIQILPLDCGAHLGLDGTFALFEFPDGGRLASLESLVNSFYLEDDESVQAYSHAFQQIRESALGEEETRRRLVELGRDLQDCE